ncbi:PREDICTED: uncharacterized protein LOC105567266 [Vollenhovia emeryi]|uniref:uncharacterized protein LOC105567266 n=1 Tax=Vollenhovia emeryi TaxID=411798 RepID=UPI0005F4C3CB|nr:PREDICTED: uncharacterized protein LOC105567266 [Vollenhovia emeryi]
MSKITIISCIIAAVCVFQTAEAGIFDKPVGSLFGDMQKKVTDTIGEVQDLGNKIQNRGQEIAEGVKNGIQQSQKQLETSTECTTAYNEGQNAINEILTSFDTCLESKLHVTSDQFNNFIKAAENFEESASKVYQDGYNCLGTTMTAIPCILNVWEQEVPQLRPLAEETLVAATELAGIFPDIRECYEESFQKVAKEVAPKFIKNAQQCLKTVLRPFAF